MSYVSGAAEPVSDCVMCDIAASSDDRERLVLVRGLHAFAVLNLFPYNTAHTLVLPYAHGGELSLVSPETGLELWQLTQRLVATIQQEYSPDGFNVGMNLGRVAGAGIPDHLHLHIVPRWGGDTNFMPVTAETKVLPEALEQTWTRLHTALKRSP
ncbi:MAG: HIT family protein [Chloroflexota bacterium]